MKDSHHHWIRSQTLGLTGLTGLLALACAAPPEEPVASDPPAEENRLTPEQVAADVREALDTTADPCQDFYRYACGGWVDTTELPGDKTRWVRSFSEIQEANQEAIRQMLEDAAASPGEAGTDQHRLGDFYGSCMDEETIDQRGADPIAPLLAEVDQVADGESLLRATGLLHRNGFGGLFAMGPVPDFKQPDLNLAFFMQGGLGMPDRDFYLSDDEKRQELLEQYEAHVAKMLGLLGADEAEAASRAAAIVAFETKLATASRSRQDLRIREKLYNKVDVAGLQDMTPTFPWDVYLGAIGHPEIESANVAVPEFFESLEDIVAETPPEVLSAYLRWHLVNGAAAYLSDDFVQADFEFYGRAVTGQAEIEPRWKRCVEATEDAMGEVIGRSYVERYFAGESKEVGLEMISDIQGAFETSLPALAWMDETTRERAVEKARAVKKKIGYPDKWRDYSSLELSRGDFFANVLSANRVAFDYELDKVGQPVDPDEWGMTPQMVNAYYNPLQNEIAFPAGILQPPFFHRDFPAAMNYGAVGAVMGHELSHGFDDQGRKFAPDGQLRDWWEPAATERFEEQAQCVDDFYSGYEIEPGKAVNGRLTLGENIADLGGVKQAFKAYKSWEDRHGAPEPAVEGLTNDQLFFVSFAQVWCSLVTPEQAELRLTTDPHSPTQFRAVGPLANAPAFAEAFQCPAGSPMAPENRCEVW